MTDNETEKISAGVYDSNRQSPIYVGDVYKEQGAMIPYYKVIKDPEKGFMVEHVGTTEKFLLKDDAKNLTKKEYLGNIFDTPDWDELTGNKKETELNRHPQSETAETATEEKTDSIPKTPELAEETTAETTEETEQGVVPLVGCQPSDDPAPAPPTTDEADTQIKEKTTENKENVTKLEENNENKKNNNPPLEVVANSKEEKKLQEQRNDYQKRVDALKRKNDELETEAVRFENLASTLTFEPFVELKMIVSNAVQDYAKKQEIKECEKHLKNYKAIDSMEALLEDYKDLAEKNRANIDLNNKEIDDYEVKITEINSKLTNFQTKLFDTETVTEQIKKEDESGADNNSDTEKTSGAGTQENEETSAESEPETKEDETKEDESEIISEEEIPF